LSFISLSSPLCKEENGGGGGGGGEGIGGGNACFHRAATAAAMQNVATQKAIGDETNDPFPLCRYRGVITEMKTFSKTFLLRCLPSCTGVDYHFELSVSKLVHEDFVALTSSTSSTPNIGGEFKQML